MLVDVKTILGCGRVCGRAIIVFPIMYSKRYFVLENVCVCEIEDKLAVLSIRNVYLCLKR